MMINLRVVEINDKNNSCLIGLVPNLVLKGVVKYDHLESVDADHIDDHDDADDHEDDADHDDNIADHEDGDDDAGHIAADHEVVSYPSR